MLTSLGNISNQTAVNLCDALAKISVMHCNIEPAWAQKELERSGYVHGG